MKEHTKHTNSPAMITRKADKTKSKALPGSFNKRQTHPETTDQRSETLEGYDLQVIRDNLAGLERLRQLTTSTGIYSRRCDFLIPNRDELVCELAASLSGGEIVAEVCETYVEVTYQGRWFALLDISENCQDIVIQSFLMQPTIGNAYVRREAVNRLNECSSLNRFRDNDSDTIVVAANHHIGREGLQRSTVKWFVGEFFSQIKRAEELLQSAGFVSGLTECSGGQA